MATQTFPNEALDEVADGCSGDDANSKVGLNQGDRDNWYIGDT